MLIMEEKSMGESSLRNQIKIQSSRCFIQIQMEVVDEVVAGVDMEVANQEINNKTKI